MVVKSPPGSTLEVVEPDLLLQLLVVALDAPAELREADQRPDRRVGGDGREPELRRLLLPSGPLAQEPLLFSRRFS